MSKIERLSIDQDAETYFDDDGKYVEYDDHAAALRKVKAKLKDARATLAALRQDAERLDWFGEHGEKIRVVNGGCVRAILVQKGETIRGAIDRARHPETGESA